jgi:hypothetical protein
MKFYNLCEIYSAEGQLMVEVFKVSTIDIGVMLDGRIREVKILLMELKN